jgi:hypothetical protein
MPRPPDGGAAGVRLRARDAMRRNVVLKDSVT